MEGKEKIYDTFGKSHFLYALLATEAYLSHYGLFKGCEKFVIHVYIAAKG